MTKKPKIRCWVSRDLDKHTDCFDFWVGTAQPSEFSFGDWEYDFGTLFDDLDQNEHMAVCFDIARIFFKGRLPRPGELLEITEKPPLVTRRVGYHTKGDDVDALPL